MRFYLPKAAVQKWARLLDGRFWRKHPGPFSKTKAGKRRRAERRFRQAQRAVSI